MIRSVVFDYDGTLANSNGLKREAYFRIFRRWPDAEMDLGEVLKEDPGADRFAVIRTTLDRLQATGRLSSAGQVESTMAELTTAYNEICEEGAAICDEMPGATWVLEELRGRYPLYIASATPEQALRRIVDRRQWTSYFRGVYGRPSSKPEILTRIGEREQAEPRELVLVGDSEADWAAARVHGCQFIAVGELGGSPIDCQKVRHLTELVESIGQFDQ